MVVHNKIRALIVEDSNTAMLDLEDKLSTLIPKENISLASNFTDAVRLLESKVFDIAFIDLLMPEQTGMDLIVDVIYENPKTKNIPVVVTTSMDPDSLATDSLKKYTYRYLFKPIEVEELEEALANLNI